MISNEQLDTQAHIVSMLQAVESAERVLEHFEARHPDDDRPRKAIESGRAWARGESTRALPPSQRMLLPATQSTRLLVSRPALPVMQRRRLMSLGTRVTPMPMPLKQISLFIKTRALNEK
jgi:hypothetical protein